MTILICTNCNGKIKLSQRQIEIFFDYCQGKYILRDTITRKPKCSHCHLRLDEMTNTSFKEVRH